MTDPATGEASVLAATDAGELVKLDRRGRRSAWMKLSDGISDLAVLEYPGRAQSEIVASLRDGSVVVCDRNLLVRASAACPGAVKALFPAGKDGEAELFYGVEDKAATLLRHRPVFLRPSRTY